MDISTTSSWDTFRTIPYQTLSPSDEEILNAIMEEQRTMAIPNWASKVMKEMDFTHEQLCIKAHDHLMLRFAEWEENRPVNRLLKRSLRRQHTFNMLTQWKEGLRLVGKTLGKAIKSKDAGTLAHAINEIELGSHGVPSWLNKQALFVTLWAKNSDLMESLFACTDCGSVHSDNYRYYTDNEDDAICESCSQSNYRWSDEMDCHIRRNSASRYFPSQRSYENSEPDWITSEYAASNDIYWNDGCDAYTAEDVYDDESNEDESSEDSSDGRFGLTDYHNSRRRFIVHQANPNAIFTNMPPLGLELEVYAEDRLDTCRDLQENFKPVGDLLKERDGSLDGYHGLELITDPLGYEEWMDMGPRLLKQLKKTECVAYNADHSDNSYGIHITLHRKYLSPLQEARFFLFMVAEENKSFIKAIAQRNGIYGGSIDMGSQSKDYQNVCTIGGLGYETSMNKKKVLGAGKYAPINFKGDLAEIRIFQATLHEPSFMKNIEFVWAVVEWLRSSTGAKWSYIDFMKWLGQNRIRARHDYPNLYAYLLRPSYRIKKFSGVINNTWAHMLRVPNPNPALPTVVLTVSDDSLLAA
jgi:hypothetical protein